MRKLFSLILALVLALGLACARAEEGIPDLTGDWALAYNVIGTEILQYVYIYEDGTFDILDDESGESGKGTWVFDGTSLTLTLVEGDEMVLAWDGENHQLTGEYGGIPVTMKLPIEPEEPEQIPDGMLSGGWETASDTSVTGETVELVNKALDGLVGVNYTPVLYLGSQVVAGMNHAILCRAEVVVPDARPYWVILYLYEDLEGNVSILNIADLTLGI